MERIIVTVQRRGESQECDLELPADLSAEALVRELSLAWGWRESYEVYAQPPDRLLAPHETLAQARVWDGARLILHPSGMGRSAPQGAVSPPQASSAPSPPGGPVKGWRPLGVTVGQPSVEPEPPPSSGGYTWKRVDED